MLALNYDIMFKEIILKFEQYMLNIFITFNTKIWKEFGFGYLNSFFHKISCYYGYKTLFLKY